LSPLLYKGFSNPLLKTLEDEHPGMRIGSVHIASPTCADDILLISKSIFELQSMLLVQEHFANCECYLISETKSRLMSINSKKHSINETVMLHDAPLEQVDSYKHIGIQRDSNKSTLVSERIKLARRTLYALMGAGLHGYNGVNPEVGIKLWNIYVCPRLLFGLESVVLKKDYTSLNLYHKSILKIIQNVPGRTADEGVYILSGQLPIESVLHYQILIRLGNILRNQMTVSRGKCVLDNYW
jgi:hypothetical protein